MSTGQQVGHRLLFDSEQAVSLCGLPDGLRARIDRRHACVEDGQQLALGRRHVGGGHTQRLGCGGGLAQRVVLLAQGGVQALDLCGALLVLGLQFALRSLGLAGLGVGGFLIGTQVHQRYVCCVLGLDRLGQLVAVSCRVLPCCVVLGLKESQGGRGLGLRALPLQQLGVGLALPLGGRRSSRTQHLQPLGHLRGAGGGFDLARSQLVGFLAQFPERGQRLALLAQAADFVGELLELRRRRAAVAPEGFNRLLQFLDAVFTKGFNAQFEGYVPRTCACHGVFQGWSGQ